MLRPQARPAVGQRPPLAAFPSRPVALKPTTAAANPAPKVARGGPTT